MNLNAKTKKYWALALVFVLLFAVLALLLKAVDPAPVAADESTVGLSTLNMDVRRMLDADGTSLTYSVDGGKTFYNKTLYGYTEMAGYICFASAAFFALLGLAQLVKGKSLKKVDASLYALAAMYLAVFVCYVLFEKFICVNIRPVIADLEEGAEASYPSSHTLFAVTLLGAAMHQISLRWGKTPVGKAAIFLCGVVMAFVVIGRLMCGVHWFTDILGGVFLGAALLFAYMGAAEKLNAR